MALLIIAIAIGLAGIILIWIGINKHPGLMRKALLLTGSSLLGIPVFSVIHNLMYAGAEIATIDFIKTTCEILHTFFFILSVIVCPVGFVAGVVWIIVKSREV